MQIWEIRSSVEGSYLCSETVILDNKIRGGWKDKNPIPVFYVNQRVGFIDPETGHFESSQRSRSNSDRAGHDQEPQDLIYAIEGLRELPR